MKDIFGTKNEILLGINPCIYGLNYHDPSVVVFINGEVVFGIEEERCNRIKGSKGMFPSSAIKQSLIHCNLTWDDIDAIVIGYDPALWMDRLNLEILDIIQKCKNDTDINSICGSRLIDSIINTNIIDRYSFFRCQGHANLVAVEAQKGTTVVANTAAAAMGVASMVVGQYYMTQINAELAEISDGISQIQDFQDNEYRSRVFSLVAHVKKIADFQTEILENDELRLSKIAQLDSLEEECTQLLGQANLTLAGFAKKTGLDYEAYEKALGNAQNWFMYQKSLLDVLYKISDLRYTLHLGAVSREQCVALLPTYTKQVSDTQERLTAWHDGTTQRLGIETDEIRRKRAGFDSVIHFIPGLFNDDFNFRSIEKKTAKMITAQASGHESLHVVDTSELYAEDVQLISKDGKIYYLPESKAE